MELDLRAIRKKQGFSQKALAKKLFLTPQAISRWECGLSQPKAEMLPKIAEALNCDISELFVLGMEDANRPFATWDPESNRFHEVDPAPAGALTAGESRLLDAYRRADEHTRRLVELALEPFAPQKESSEAM